AIRESAGPPSGPPPRRATGKPEFGICAPCGSAGPRSVRPLRSCAQFDRGKRSRYPGLPAPQGQLSGRNSALRLVQNTEQQVAKKRNFYTRANGLRGSLKILSKKRGGPETGFVDRLSGAARLRRCMVD